MVFRDLLGMGGGTVITSSFLHLVEDLRRFKGSLPARRMTTSARVTPGPNRGRADEVSYNLHIIIRSEPEQAMLSGDLPVADLPGAWNEAYRTYLGVTPRNDAEGCLQDGHWSEGMIGYFPTYPLGNLYAAQLFERADRDLGGVEEAFARGDFGCLLGWPRDRVHRHGSRYSAKELVERATRIN